MSKWTHINGVIIVEPMGRCQAEARYVLDMVLTHLPKVPGSEGDMEVYVNQKRGFNSSCTNDEFGQRSNLGNEESHRMFDMQTQYILTINADLRDTVFAETYKNFQKWLCRLSKRLLVEKLLVTLSGDDKSIIFQDSKPYEEMFEYPLGSIGNTDNKPAWYDFLRWQTVKGGSYPMLLAYKYFANKENDAEVNRLLNYSFDIKTDE